MTFHNSYICHNTHVYEATDTLRKRQKVKRVSVRIIASQDFIHTENQHNRHNTCWPILSSYKNIKPLIQTQQKTLSLGPNSYTIFGFRN